MKKKQPKKKENVLEITNLRWSDNGYKRRYEEYEIWVKDFEYSDKGIKIRDVLRGIAQTHQGEKFNWLKKEVFWVCFNALIYDPKKDQMKLKEDNRKAGAKKAENVLASIDRLRDFNKTFPVQGVFGCSKIADTLIKHGFTRKGPGLKKLLIQDFFDEILKSYKEGLEEYLKLPTPPPTQKRGWFVGGIHYPIIKLDGKPFKIPPDPKKSSLFLHLVKVFRHFTEGNLNLGWAGEPMPEFGQPCWSSVAEISNALLAPKKKKITNKDVTNIVTRLVEAGATVHSWNLPS